MSIILALIRPETISELLGRESGFYGVLIGVLIGSVTLIPGFIAFPVAALFLKNGAGYAQVAAFVSSLMMVGGSHTSLRDIILWQKSYIYAQWSFFYIFSCNSFCYREAYMKKIPRKYLMSILMIIILFILYLLDEEAGKKASNAVYASMKEMFVIIPPVFIILGLLDEWVSREMVAKHMGRGSGIKGILLSFFIGSAAAGPLYISFPIAGLLVKKGVKFSNIFIFIGAWSTTKVPMFLFEMASLGKRFAIMRLALNIPIIIITAYVLDFFVEAREKEDIMENIKKMDI